MLVKIGVGHNSKHGKQLRDFEALQIFDLVADLAKHVKFGGSQKNFGELYQLMVLQELVGLVKEKGVAKKH